MAQEAPPRIQVLDVPATVRYRGLLCKWEIQKYPQVWVKHRGPVSERFHETYESPARYVSQDPWKLRDEFLGLSTVQEFLNFLNRFGRFASFENPQLIADSLAAGQVDAKDLEDVTGHWDVGDLRCWQKTFQTCLTHSPDRWPGIIQSIWTSESFQNVKYVLQSAETFQIRFSWEANKPHAAVIETQDIVAAILATIKVDRLSGKEFGFCARPDCRKAFEFTSSHHRKYCEQYCAHLESLRRLRKRRRKNLKSAIRQH